MIDGKRLEEVVRIAKEQTNQVEQRAIALLYQSGDMAHRTCDEIREAEEGVREILSQAKESMNPYFAVFNGHVNDAHERAKAFMQQQFRDEWNVVEAVSKEGNGIMAVFQVPPSSATLMYAALVTAFVNEA